MSLTVAPGQLAAAAIGGAAQAEAAGVAPDLPRAPDHRQEGALRQPRVRIRINELPEQESDEILAFLFEHQLQPRFRFVHRWTEGDVLFWDDIGTLHNAHADYGPDEPRLIKRCQVMADKIFDPAFVRAALAEPAVA